MAKYRDEIVKPLSDSQIDQGYELFEKWGLECCDPDDFSVWLSLYLDYPDKMSGGDPLPPRRYLFCGEADRGSCQIYRLNGKCVLKKKQFQAAEDYAATAELRDAWEYMDILM